MRYSLKAKLSISYIFIVLISVLLISFLSNIFLERQFRNYVKQNQEQKNSDIIASISQQYKEYREWNDRAIESIGVNALEYGIIIKISDNSGKTVLDAKVHNNGMCQQIIEHMSRNMISRYPNIKGTYFEKPYPVYYDGSKVGLVSIGSYGPFYLSDTDLAFINTLNKMLFGVGLLCLIIALLLGNVMAKRMSSPISRVISAANRISKGDYTQRITEKSNTAEITQLVSTINDLAINLKNQETLRKRLTGDVAHELRTPLATLQSHFEAMIEGIWKPDRERLISCHEEIIRINNLVGDLQKLTKYESENLVLNKTSFNISELIKNIINNFESEYRNKGLKLCFQADEQYIEADKDKISQVLINLISNALKYTPTGGLVEVSVVSADTSVEIMVSDNGTGISEEDIPFIFERFYRADKSRNRMTGGSGIGLTISKAIIEAHGGTIGVESKLNQGTKIAFTLPKK
jgi:signal transduction histidine kinase